MKSNTGSGARLIPIMTKKRRDTLSQQQIDCITPKSNIVGHIDGKPYIGDFHVMPNGNKMTGQTHSNNDRIIYNTPQESLRSGNVISRTRAERPTFRSIGQLITLKAKHNKRLMIWQTWLLIQLMKQVILHHQVHHHQVHHHQVHHQVVVEVDMGEDINVLKVEY